MPTSTVEDYLKAILLHEQPLESGQLVSMGQIGLALDVAPGTVTAMVKALDKGGMLTYEPYSGVRLTEDGRRTALHVLRRHRLVELFLVEVLGLDWSEVHEEAERLEHAISDKLVGRIDALLGYPSVDPHGDPIPDGRGRLRQPKLVSLQECEVGLELRVARVSDQDESFLRFVERHNLKPGAFITVRERETMADSVTILPRDLQPITIGGEAAAKLWVEPIGEPEDEKDENGEQTS